MAALAARLAMKAGPKLLKGASKMPMGGGGAAGAAAAGAGVAGAAAAGAVPGYGAPGHSGPITVTVNGPSWAPMARVPPIEGVDLTGGGGGLGGAIGGALASRASRGSTKASRGSTKAPKGGRGRKSGFMNPGDVPGQQDADDVFIIGFVLAAFLIFFISRN